MSVSALLVASASLSSAALAADAPVAASNRGDIRQAPNLMLGGGVGYASHWGQSYDVDVVSAASAPPVEGSAYRERGIALSAFADFAAVDLGRGNLGLQAGYTLALPKNFMNFALEPRYRFRFPVGGTMLHSVEPWLGLGVAFAFREKLDKSYYLWLPLSAGCDFSLGAERLYAGIAVTYNMVNPKGASRTFTASGERHQYDAHMNNLVVLMRLSYLAF